MVSSYFATLGSNTKDQECVVNEGQKAEVRIQTNNISYPQQESDPVFLGSVFNFLIHHHDPSRVEVGM